MSVNLPIAVETKTLPRAWLVIALLCPVGCLNYLDRIMLTTMRDSITGSIRMTDAQFGLLTSVFLWIYGLLSPFSGFLADRFNRSKVIIGSLFLWSLVTWLTAHAQTSTAGLYATIYIHPLSLAGGLIGGHLTDRWSRKSEFGRLVVPAIALLIAAPAIFIASSTSTAYIAIIGFMFYAFTRVFGDVNMMPILCMIADSRYRATGYGVLNMFACIVGGLGIYASGILRDASFQMDNLFKTAAGLL